eukprot:jgi/Hompol1/3188/HPOL_006393-RA
MAASGPMALVDYLDKYNTTCEKKNITTVAAVKRVVERAIDSGDTPDSFQLNGMIPELRFRRLDDETVESIFLPMVGVSFVRCVDLSYNEIGDRGAFSIAKVLKDDISIEVLILRSNNITGDGAAAIAKSLTYNEKLVTLDISANSIGDDGGMALATLLQVNANISDLNLSGCSLAATSLIAFATVLQSNSSVMTLNLSDNMLSTSRLSQTLVNDIMARLAQTLQLNYGLKTLNLSKIGITDWNMCDLLASALKANKNIETLNLSW